MMSFIIRWEGFNMTENLKQIKKMKSIETKYVSLFLVIGVIINTGFLVILFMSLHSNIDFFINISSILIVFQFLSGFYFITKIEDTLFSLTSIFYVVSNLFHLGQIFLIRFGIQVPRIEYIIYKVDNQVLMNSIFYVFACHATFIIGVLVFYNTYKSKKINVVDEKLQRFNLVAVKKIGWILFAIGIIPQLYIDITRLKLFLSGAYINTYSISVSGILAFVASLTEIAILMFLIAYKDKKKTRKTILILSLLYQGIVIYSGHRGPALVFIITMFFVYFKLGPKIKKRTVLLLSVVGYLTLLLINVIGATRSLLNRNYDLISTILLENLGLNVIWEFLAEFGSSIVSVAYAIMFFPEHAPIQFGTNYAISILTIFPNIANFVSVALEKINFISLFPSNYGRFLGGSYIAESYYSFNVLGPLFILFVGGLVAYISIKIKMTIQEHNWIKLSYTLVLFTNVLWWTRDFFGSMIRQVIWTNILIYLLIHFFVKKSRLYNINNREVDKKVIVGGQNEE